MQVLLRPRLRTPKASRLSHSVDPGKSQVLARFRKWRNRFDLLRGGVARPHHKDMPVMVG